MESIQTLAKATDATDDSTWNELNCLCRICLIAFYNTRAPVQTQLFVPELAHLITLLAGTGPLLMKTTVYGLLINLIQSLCAARWNDPDSIDALTAMLYRCSQSEVLKMFGLERVTRLSNEYTLSSDSTTLDVDALEGISSILLHAIDLGAQTTGT
jgi:neurofibromin 1